MASTLIVAGLDCHLNWDLKKGATKINIEDVIKEIHKILSNQWLLLPNQILLCYLYNDPDNADIPKAKEALLEAEKANDSQFYDTEACQWIIEANRLCMEKDNLILGQNLKARYEAFSDAQVATVKALHAYCLVRFGPNGYSDASTLYDEVNQLTRYENFMFLFLHALLLAKVRRVPSMFSTATVKEEKLWQSAEKISETNGMATDSMEYINFLGRYAEAALGFEDKKVAIEISSNFEVEKRSEGELKLIYKALLKFHKAFRVSRGRKYAFTEKVKERMVVLTKRLFDLESAGIQDSQFYHTLALELYYEVKAPSSEDTSARQDKLMRCESLLLKAQEYAAKPGHTYVDLMLVDVQIDLGKLSHESTQDKYVSLEQIHRRSKINVATIRVNRAWHLITKAKKLDDGMKLIERTVNNEKSCMRRTFDKCKEIIQVLTDLNRFGYLAWIKHVGRMKPVEEVLELFNEFLSTAENTAEAQFVTVQLAFLYLKRGQLTEAEKLEHKISDQEEKLRVELERRLALLSVDKEYSPENCLRLATIAKSCPARCLEVCTQLLSKLEVLSGDNGWKPQGQEAYELCATISLAIGAHGDDSNKAETETKVNRVLQISAGAEDNMRKYRLQATQLYLTDPISDDAVNMRNSLLLQTMRTAKTCLDSCVQILFPHSKACFPFAFVLRTESGPNQPINDFILESRKDRKNFDRSFERSFRKVESYKKALRKGEDKDLLKKRSDGLKECKKWLQDREYSIFTTEGSWLSHWVYVRNQNAHNNPTGESLIETLEQDLRQDREFNELHGLVGGPRSAYELAHRAAEFAEETRAWFQETAASLGAANGAVCAGESSAHINCAGDR